MNNCMECGRLVAPSSGLRGADTSNLFCCRKCLKAYYDSQPGLWKREEEANERYLIEEEERQQQLAIEREQQEIEQKEKDAQKLIVNSIMYTILAICFICLLRSCH